VIEDHACDVALIASFGRPREEQDTRGGEQHYAADQSPRDSSAMSEEFDDAHLG
jgi:hypothetical protein